VLDVLARNSAEAIETFFSTVSRGHHAAEEQDIFPCLLSSGKPDTVVLVRDLIEDHFWIEKFWQDLSPLLKDIAQGAQIDDTAKFEKTATTFLELCSQHVEVEESMIYPEAKQRLTGT
jgi:hemerythrin-like domain-containing protein